MNASRGKYLYLHFFRLLSFLKLDIVYYNLQEQDLPPYHHIRDKNIVFYKDFNIICYSHFICSKVCGYFSQGYLGTKLKSNLRKDIFSKFFIFQIVNINYILEHICIKYFL